VKIFNYTSLIKLGSVYILKTLKFKLYTKLKIVSSAETEDILLQFYVV